MTTSKQGNLRKNADKDAEIKELKKEILLLKYRQREDGLRTYDGMFQTLQVAEALVEKYKKALEYYGHGEGAHSFYGVLHEDVSKVEHPDGYSYLSGKLARKTLEEETKTFCKDCGTETTPGSGSARCPDCWDDRCGA